MTRTHVSNTVLVFSPAGDIAARYDKIHLFRFDDGHQSYDESRVLRAGEQPLRLLVRPTAPASPGGWA